MVIEKTFNIPAVVFALIFFCFAGIRMDAGQGIFKGVPQKINPKGLYLFFLHGQIVENQGIRPTSEKYGTYEYRKILDTFKEKGFIVISEAREKNTNVLTYAKKITGQVNRLVTAGVPQENITVVGASKGGAIVFYVSSEMKLRDINYVIIAACVGNFAQDAANLGLNLTGNVLSIYDLKDEYFGSCQPFFEVAKDKGLNRYKEIAVDMGNGHGFHYVPAKEWIHPVIEWARGKI
ncbi:MAG: alpha/beta hydrolase [Candidatus Aminicenantes bacterium]|nr:alpha/beta hydrolase [Candidatus Aminicenantes bacterium]